MEWKSKDYYYDIFTRPKSYTNIGTVDDLYEIWVEYVYIEVSWIWDGSTILPVMRSQPELVLLLKNQKGFDLILEAISSNWLQKGAGFIDWNSEISEILLKEYEKFHVFYAAQFDVQVQWESVFFIYTFHLLSIYFILFTSSENFQATYKLCNAISKQVNSHNSQDMTIK